LTIKTKSVITPDGDVQLSGCSRIIVADIIDVWMYLSLFNLIVLLFESLNYLSDSILVYIALTIAFVAIFFIRHSHRRLIGMGEWALSLRRYSFSEIRGYSGKGSISCVELLSRKKYSVRTLITAGIVFALFALNYFLS
jgi:hypothetical protein